jgi:hypothetical protein
MAMVRVAKGLITGASGSGSARCGQRCVLMVVLISSVVQATVLEAAPRTRGPPVAFSREDHPERSPIRRGLRRSDLKVVTLEHRPGITGDARYESLLLGPPSTAI